MAKFSFDLPGNAQWLAALVLAASAASVVAQTPVVNAQQRATAAQVAQQGVLLSELQPDAPPHYRIRAGDTLWGIAGLFLKNAWRWPELWGMNLSEIRNPHLIYPGQTLRLTTDGNRARLSLQASPAETPAGQDQSAATDEPPTVRLSPRIRSQALPPSALPTLKSHLIEPFLAEPIVLDTPGLDSAPRIVAAQDSRVLLTRGDRAYARGNPDSALVDIPNQKQQKFRVFRNTKPLKDPISGEVLGHEAQYIGQAMLVQSESSQSHTDAEGKERVDTIPAMIDIVDAKEEMRVGDRLLPEPPPQLQSYVPHAPASPLEARVVSIYGSAVVNAAQNQVVALNRGQRDGLEPGMVLAIMRDGARLTDKTDPTQPPIKLPDERNGLLMVFRTFDKLSYALVLDITSGVRVGDRLINPR